MPNVNSFEEKLRWFFVAAYLADAVKLLDKDKRLKLAHLAEQYAGEETWQSVVEVDQGINKTFVKSLYGVCRKQMGNGASLCFILRGLGCPYPEARMCDIIGGKMEE